MTKRPAWIDLAVRGYAAGYDPQRWYKEAVAKAAGKRYCWDCAANVTEACGPQCLLSDPEPKEGA